MICSSLEHLEVAVAEWKSVGDRIVFTNGVFDILHIGHVTYLEEARRRGDRLVVGVNDDESVRRLNKAPGRPINPEHARAAIIGALRCVDAAILFGEDTPLWLIEAIQPDVLIKGGDYDPEEKNPKSKTFIVGSDLVKKAGGRVEIIQLVPGFSTTSIVGKIKED